MKHAATLSRSVRVQARSIAFPVAAPATTQSEPLDLGIPKEKRLFTIPETARYLQVSATTVRNMIDCGTLVAGHVGMSPTAKRQCLRVTRQSVEQLQRERFGG